MGPLPASLLSIAPSLLLRVCHVLGSPVLTWSQGVHLDPRSQALSTAIF